MKRYLLFAGDIYYPAGGWRDFIGDFDVLDEAKARLIRNRSYDWYQIYDTKHNEIVEEN